MKTEHNNQAADFREGLWNLNKPLEITSSQAVMRIKRASGIKKVGHGGTLDPLATGVLVLAIGRKYTRQLDQVVGAKKEYHASIYLGQESTTDDAEGEKSDPFQISKHSLEEDFNPPTEEKIKSILSQFIGHIQQIPPAYSAVKISGQEAYKRVRRGEEVEIAPRQVEVKKIEILTYKWPLLELKITCGKGVYIRSLARDLGRQLQTGAFLVGLERTRVGEFKIENSWELEELEENMKKFRRELETNYQSSQNTSL
jgi:tRNA pseudouridine55 synthase